jgi:hypothetical protein
MTAIDGHLPPRRLDLTAAPSGSRITVRNEANCYWEYGLSVGVAGACGAGLSSERPLWQSINERLRREERADHLGDAGRIFPKWIMTQTLEDFHLCIWQGISQRFAHWLFHDRVFASPDQ